MPGLPKTSDQSVHSRKSSERDGSRCQSRRWRRHQLLPRPLDTASCPDRNPLGHLHLTRASSEIIPTLAKVPLGENVWTRLVNSSVMTTVFVFAATERGLAN
jgi:hypothetical protein